MNFLSEMQLLQKWCLIPENNITSPEESVQHMVCALAGDIGTLRGYKKYESKDCMSTK